MINGLDIITTDFNNNTEIYSDYIVEDEKKGDLQKQINAIVLDGTSEISRIISLETSRTNDEIILSTHTTQISNLQNSVNLNTTNITSNTTNIANNTTNITNLQTYVTDNSTDIDNLVSNVNTINNDITNLKNEYNTLDTEIKIMQGESIATDAAISGIEGQIVTINAALSTAQTEISLAGNNIALLQNKTQHISADPLSTTINNSILKINNGVSDKIVLDPLSTNYFGNNVEMYSNNLTLGHSIDDGLITISSKNIVFNGNLTINGIFNEPSNFYNQWGTI